MGPPAACGESCRPLPPDRATHTKVAFKKWMLTTSHVGLDFDGGGIREKYKESKCCPVWICVQECMYSKIIRTIVGTRYEYFGKSEANPLWIFFIACTVTHSEPHRTIWAFL